jgi:8-oxo-dGTP pyrophosphatase MutT (NUDIX family)
MRFDSFRSQLNQLQGLELPGMDAHDAILPFMAKERKLAFDLDPNPKISSVAATIFPKYEQAFILLIQRQSYEGVHSDQVGFPGGKREEGDPDLAFTALREMEEEVGVPRNEPILVRSLTQVYIPPSRFLVQPFLYYLNHRPEFIPEEREVSAVIEMPVAHLLSDESVVEGIIKMSNGISIKTPYFEYQGYRIWGATAMMLSELKALLKQLS